MVQMGKNTGDGYLCWEKNDVRKNAGKLPALFVAKKQPLIN